VAYVGTLEPLQRAAYVPLNRKFPVERSRSMARRRCSIAVIVDRQSAAAAAVLDGIGYTRS
jgi:hypothetical protein